MNANFGIRNEELKMKNLKNITDSECYKSPKLEIVELDVSDIITTSPGTETTPKEDNDGIWDLDLD